MGAWNNQRGLDKNTSKHLQFPTLPWSKASIKENRDFPMFPCRYPHMQDREMEGEIHIHTFRLADSIEMLWWPRPRSNIWLQRYLNWQIYLSDHLVICDRW